MQGLDLQVVNAQTPTNSFATRHLEIFHTLRHKEMISLKRKKKKVSIQNSVYSFIQSLFSCYIFLNVHESCFQFILPQHGGEKKRSKLVHADFFKRFKIY